MAIVGAGLAGLSAARSLMAAGIEPLVLEARDRVGGRTLTGHFVDGTFVDEGGQWISPGQERIVALAAELGVALFPSWSEGATVHWSDGARHEATGLFLPGEDAVAKAVRQAARELAAMAREVQPDAPWQSPRAAEWDRVSLHDWLAANVGPVRARRVLATAFEGVFASNTTRASLLAALFWAQSGDPLTPFVATADPGPERRFVGGAQQISKRMADDLGDQVLLGIRIRGIQYDADRVIAETADLRIEARRAIITLPPALCARILYVPAMPRERDHLCQRVPMRWVIKVHCLYPSRFWAEAGLSGAVTSDAGVVRVCADNSPPSGAPGVLVGFIEEDQAVRLAGLAGEERRAAVWADLGRYFGAAAERPLEYREHDWGADEFSRGADAGYWAQGVWTTYGAALRRPVGRLHWAGSETSPMWNGKMEGAILSGVRAAAEVLATM